MELPNSGLGFLGMEQPHFKAHGQLPCPAADASTAVRRNGRSGVRMTQIEDMAFGANAMMLFLGMMVCCGAMGSGALYGDVSQRGVQCQLAIECDAIDTHREGDGEIDLNLREVEGGGILIHPEGLSVSWSANRQSLRRLILPKYQAERLPLIDLRRDERK